MAGRFRKLKIAAAVVAAIVLLVFLNNTSMLADPIAERPFLVAHRGLGQGFHREGLTGATCTAARMLPPEHDYLENTIRGIRAAFDFGADIVEFDVHPTTDGRFAVFHDWTVDCRTEGSGTTREHTLEELQRLDIGYGYTADGGRTWPFRGKGVGLVPSLDEVLATFPDRSFFIDVKGNDPGQGEALAERLAERSTAGKGEIMFVGGRRPLDVIRQRLPQARTMTGWRLKRCLKRYLAAGWTGYVPAECRRSVLFVPANVAPWMWGWPNRFLQRMDRHGTRVILIGDYFGGGFSSGFDDPGRLPELPADYSGGIWTDRIDLIGPAVRAADR